jgi:hypothetical protein
MGMGLVCVFVDGFWGLCLEVESWSEVVEELGEGGEEGEHGGLGSNALR